MYTYWSIERIISSWLLGLIFEVSLENSCRRYWRLLGRFGESVERRCLNWEEI